MCIAVPMRVLTVSEGSALCADADECQSRIDLALVGPVAPGDWLLTFLGAAREIIDAERALSIARALRALAGVMRGDAAAIDAAFPDLIGREPQLPDFLIRR